ncbi:MAG: protein translocase subunit SecF, partial [Alphaproteobacteria bacterium]
MAVFPLRLVPPNTKIDFIGRRKAAFVFSALLVALSLVFFAVKGLNYGIDFKGGILMEVRTPGAADIDALRKRLSGLGLGEVALQEFGQPTDVLIRIERQPGGEKGQLVAVEKVKEALGKDVASYRRTEFVGPKVGGELIQAGILANDSVGLFGVRFLDDLRDGPVGIDAVDSMHGDLIGGDT